MLVVQHQDDCPPALIGEWLIEAGCVLDVRRPYAGDALPDDLAGHDAFMVLGGSMGANDDDAASLAAADQGAGPRRGAAPYADPGRLPGSPDRAVALGGEAGRNPRGQQLGLLPLGWTDAAGQDDLTRGLVGTGYGVQWNDDIVLRAPDETVVLARTPQGELQVARFAPTVWGVQLHPEVDVHILEQWADEDRDRYDEGVLDDVLRRIDAHYDDLVAGWRPLAQAFAACP